MRTELIYLWIEQDPNGCFHREGFNFSPQYAVSYSPEHRELKIDMNHKLNIFRSEQIANVTAIIGENGTGKTTLLEYLTSLSSVPLIKETREEYQLSVQKENQERTFIAVYIEQGHEAEPRIINITDDIITFHGIEIAPYSGEDYRKENYIEQISHVYLSNTAYDIRQNRNMRQGAMISYITITDATLSTMSHSFYLEKYGFGAKTFMIENTPFHALARMFVEQENSQSMQMFIDLLFYVYLLNNKKTFQGKQLDSIEFLIKSAWKKITGENHSIPYTTKYVQKEYIDKVTERYRWIKIDEKAIWSTIIYNLVFELLFVFEDFSLEILGTGQLDADVVLKQCVAFIENLPTHKEGIYYKNAIKEIEIMKKILMCAEIRNNSNQDDLGKELLAQVKASEFNALINHIKTETSFILKYLDIRNLNMSSGERAWLNFMSRIYFASQLKEFFSQEDFLWHESVLLLIDEIDLCLHPEWQRQILYNFFNALKEAFPEQYIQIIITSHSPIILSDIPRENAIFLRQQDGKIVQVSRNLQTFGANIHNLYKDAFFIKDGLAMGEFARATINSWIEEFREKGKEIDVDNINKKLDLIGEPIIRKRMEKMLQEKGIYPVKRTMQVDERQYILDFLKAQKAAIQQQIDRLEKGYSL